ncbi:MAG: hypothetical protein COU11_03390 [Candidatus Harrisonbacteria bacterium CG10_big_fil_rev_8_21_14_0_10_49_15]|uniref:Peptidoglycan binding-like domain-containing protein n=1 Tax=Candidatus Harrisonbacteria bacterium CG10_big_fil_rev_8_21_14_0_10_49_15 TaxID=1974587 RepID=A0A2H0UKE6_9BACT|nr:MAG: hypothetical protein COU11_03390 [Candidatus Harrisonbacteria bacterium CG10_big_fil_rev_8_21_14_0_10_49_15]
MSGRQKTQWISFLGTIVTIVVFFGYFNLAQADFYRNLSIGDSGPDVLELQKTLNFLSVTRVAQTGPGSPGAETSYFGPATYAAVIKFQELYRSVILAPIGLSAGTGFVGPSTRAKLNQFSGQSAQAQPTKIVPTSPAQPQPTASTPAPSSQAPQITLITPNPVRRGQTVVVTGTGFTKDNTISLGPDEIYHLSSPDGQRLEFTMTSSIPVYKDNEDGGAEFPFWVYIDNDNGTSGNFILNFRP